jgi:hypothetical protein
MRDLNGETKQQEWMKSFKHSELELDYVDGVRAYCHSAVRVFVKNIYTGKLSR